MRAYLNRLTVGAHEAPSKRPLTELAANLWLSPKPKPLGVYGLAKIKYLSLHPFLNNTEAYILYLPAFPGLT